MIVLAAFGTDNRGADSGTKRGARGADGFFARFVLLPFFRIAQTALTNCVFMLSQRDTANGTMPGCLIVAFHFLVPIVVY